MTKSVWDRLEAASPVNRSAVAVTSADDATIEPQLGLVPPPPIRTWRKCPVLRRWFPSRDHPIDRRGQRIGAMTVRGLCFSADPT
jgi:hypothetical protein